VVRQLVDTKHPLGIVSMGTFNNFAKSLHLPTTIDAAIRVVKEGTPPEDPFLKLSVHAGSTRTDIIRRMLARAVLSKAQDDAGQLFRFRKLEVKTKPRARVYADNARVGLTPATITAELSALKVILPR
jgi:diacylglycerol kinase family enzyme